MLENKSEKIHVQLMDEVIPVWRPVDAKRIQENIYKITICEIPEFEEWEFQPGDVVKVIEIADEEENYKRAIELADEI